MASAADLDFDMEYGSELAFMMRSVHVGEPKALRYMPYIY